MSKIQVEIGIKVDRKTRQVTPIYNEIEESEYHKCKQSFLNSFCDILKELENKILEEQKCNKQ